MLSRVSDISININMISISINIYMISISITIMNTSVTIRVRMFIFDIPEDLQLILDTVSQLILEILVETLVVLLL